MARTRWFGDYDWNTIGMWVLALLVLAALFYWFKSRSANTTSGVTNATLAALDSAVANVLWRDHVHLTRSFVIETLTDYGGASDTANRLLRNQDEIGANFARTYGSQNGSQYASLLREHINLAAKLVGQVKNGEDITETNAAWYKNADDIGSFLMQVTGTDYRPHVREHLDLLTQEVTDLKGNDYSASITDLDRALNQVMGMP